MYWSGDDGFAFSFWRSFLIVALALFTLPLVGVGLLLVVFWVFPDSFWLDWLSTFFG